MEEDEFDLETIEQDLLRFQQEEVVQEALSKGIDLRSYSQQIDLELQSLQTSSIPNYIAEAPVAAALYDEMKSCDDILASMENVLQKFQSDLGDISDEIKHLQTQSISLSTKLKNRKVVESHILKVLQNVIVSEKLISIICDSEVNEVFVSAVKELDDKLRFARVQEASEDGVVAPSEVMAVQDLQPQLDKLRLKAVSKCRQFLLNQIAGLKKPKTNVQIMQQSTLIKYQSLFEFLFNNAPAVVEEIKATYVDTMSRIFHSSFKSYYASLLKVQSPGPVKEDVIAIDLAVLSSLKSASSIYVHDLQHLDAEVVSTLSKRKLALGKADTPQSMPHVLLSSNQLIYFEEIFRSVQKHLVHTAASEYLFVADFFLATSTDLFNQIFARTLSLCLENLENYLYQSADPVALMLMIRVTQENRATLKVNCLKGYFDHVNMLLWPQFKRLFDSNLKSMIAPNVCTRLGVSAVGYGAHFVSIRYAEFASTIYALGQILNPPDEMLHHNLVKLRQTFISLLDELASKSSHKVLSTEKGKAIFRVNNFDAILTCFSKTSHGVNPDDTSHFEDQLSQATTVYIEEELQLAFGPLIAFMKAEEENVDHSMDLKDITTEFSMSWKSNLNHLNTSAQNYFQSSTVSTDIVKQMLSQFLLYYARFQEAVKKKEGGDLVLVTIHDIMKEMKTYGR